MKMMLILELYEDVDDFFIRRFFNRKSKKMLDEKIEVLSQLKAGVPRGEIKNYMKVLELYPTDDNLIWDWL